MKVPVWGLQGKARTKTILTMPSSYRVTVNAPGASRIVLWQTWHRNPAAAQAPPALLRDVARATATANTRPAALALLLVLVKYPGERYPRRHRYNVSRSQTIFIAKRRQSPPTRGARRSQPIKIGPRGGPVRFQQAPSTASGAMGYRRASAIQATGNDATGNDNGAAAPPPPSEELIGTVVETAGGVFERIIDVLDDGTAVTEGGGSISASDLATILASQRQPAPAVPGYVWALGAVAALALVYGAAK